MPSPASKKNSPGSRRSALQYALLVLVLLLFGVFTPVFAQSPFPEPSSARSLFKDRPFGPHPPPTPTPRAKLVDPDEKPIPPGWYIGGAAAALLALAGLFYGAARASRSSNLFDRQYHFPMGADAALRFGATRCGGHMATIKVGPAARQPRSKAEDT